MSPRLDPEQHGQAGATGEVAVGALSWTGVVPLEQVLDHVRPAYHGDMLVQACAALRREPSEEEIILQLIQELKDAPADMLFNEPVWIGLPDPDHQDDEQDGRPVVANGMHRIAAAIAAGAPTIWVTSIDQEKVSPTFDGQLLEVDFRLTVPNDEDQDDLDIAMTWLRSFRLDPDTWVEIATLSGTNGTLHAVYHCPHQLWARLLKALCDRAQRQRCDLEIQRCSATTWEMLDLEWEDA
jgi:hypothetical protein